jgi:PDZ domain-containing protein
MLSLLRAHLLSYIPQLFIFILFIMISIPPLIQATAQSQPYQLPGAQQMTLSLGVIGIPVTPDIAQALNLSQPFGNLIVNVVEGSPADKANLKGGYTIANIGGREIVIGGDVILRIDNRAATTTNDISGYLDTKKVSDVVQLSILRDGKPQTVPVTLTAGPPLPPFWNQQIPFNPMAPPSLSNPISPTQPARVPPTILSHNNYYDNTGGLHIVGEIVNESMEEMRSVQVTASFYDSSIQIIGTQNTYTSPMNLQSGKGHLLT